MTPEQYAQICELFQAASAMPAGERPAFLDRACDGETTLRAEVERMLASDDSSATALFRTSPLVAGVRELMGNRLTPKSYENERIGPYLIQRKLGSGGMGAVYLASRVDDYQQQVAIKLIKFGLDAEQFAARFRFERQALAVLNHPHIARLLDGGATPDGQPYLVMEYIAGEPFDRHCTARQLPLNDKLRLLRQTAEAVHYAHQMSFIHRDLKPGNVLITADGVPKIVDFGLAKQLSHGDGAETLGPGQTQTGAILGTPSYMAPEQAGGKVKELGPAVDVYALGAMLYEVLTGRPPFRADTPLETVMQVLNDDPVPPCQLHPRLPRDLETICLQCLQKEPQRRYQTAAEVADEIGRYLQGEPIRARPISVLERSWRWCRKHPGVAGLTAAIAALLLLVTVSAIVFAGRESRLRSDADEARTSAEHTLHELGLVVAARELHNRDDVALAEEFLTRCPKERRGWEWHYLQRQLDGDPPVLQGHEKGVWCVAFSPNSQLLASASIDETVQLWDVPSRKVLYTFTGHRLENQMARFAGKAARDAVIPVMCVAFSPDGKYLASGSGAAVKVWEVATHKQLVTYREQKHLMLSLAWSPDGEWIVSTNWDLSVHLWNAKTGKLRHELVGHTDWVNRPAFHPTRRLLATPGMDGVTKIWEMESGREVAELRQHHGPVRDAEFSRDGRWLATAGMDGTVLLWDVDTWKVIQTFKGHSGGALAVSISPDGQRLASTGFDRKVKVWDPATGKEVITLLGHTDTVWSLAFSPDGRQIASCSFDHTVRLWDGTPRATAEPAPTAAPDEEDRRLNQVVFSPDGKQLAATSWDRSIRLLDAETREVKATLRGHTGMVWGVAYSLDGKKLATASWDRTVRLWDTATSAELHTLTGHSTLVHGVAFSHDGTLVASGGVDGTVKLWSAETGKQVKNIPFAHGPLAYSVAFSRDGRWLVTGGGDRLVKVWDVAALKKHWLPIPPSPVHTLAGAKAVVHSVAVSPDGNTIAAASWDQTTLVWRLGAPGEPQILRGHRDRVHGVAFHPDGKRLASASEDKTVRFWDLDTGQEVGSPVVHRGPVWGVAFSPDGHRFASSAWYLPAGIRVGPTPW